MPKDPLGLLARINAMSLMLITPEFYRIRQMRAKGAAQIDHDQHQFTIKPKFIDLDGMKIRIATDLKSDKPTVLLLSPLPQSILCYDAIWSQLSENANLVAVDLPGFGGSEGHGEHMTFAAQSAFLERFVDVMGLSDVHIIAPDVAMPVAMHYAIHRNHKAKSLMIGDGPGIFPSHDGSLIKKITKSGFWRTMVRLNGAKTFIAGATQLGYLHYRPKAAELEDYVQSYAVRIGQVTQYFKHYAVGCQNLTDHIETLSVPVQVFWGDEDGFLSAKNAAVLDKRLPDSHVHIFENCGHFCYQDKSDEFVSLVQRWIER